MITKLRRPRTARVRAFHKTDQLHTLAKRVRAVFQPIEDLRTGEVIGYEALARLTRGDRLLSPADFLSSLSHDALAELFRVMLEQALTLRESLGGSSANPYVSVNVEVPLVLTDGFVDRLAAVLDRHSPVPDGAVVLELLEGHTPRDFARMADRLHAIRALGVRVALDDIGSAYSSLITLRDLPVDIMKLDQSFARGLRQRPSDLHFVLSVQSLAHSIGKRLVVEGVETVEIRDALHVLGVDLGQGYGIARPMPAEAVAAWVAGRPPRMIDQSHVPTSLLGAYAGHLRVVEACRTLMGQPLPVTWQEASRDPHACGIGMYFDAYGLHDTAVGRAHKHFHTVMASYGSDPIGWRAGADGFRLELERALADPAPLIRCEAVAV